MVVTVASSNKKLYESNAFADASALCRQSSDFGVIGAETSKPEREDLT
jgi:hypothetical protein